MGQLAFQTWLRTWDGTQDGMSGAHSTWEWAAGLTCSPESCLCTGIVPSLVLLNVLGFCFFRRKERRKGGRVNECLNKKALLRVPALSDLVSGYIREPFQLGSKVLKSSPTLKGPVASRLATDFPYLREGAGLSQRTDYSGTQAHQLLLGWALHQF